MNTAHRGARIAAALVAVIFGATACGSDSKSSSNTTVNIPKPAVRDAAPIAGDAGQVPSATAAASADSAASGETPAQAPSPVVLPAAVPPDTNYLAIDVSYGIQVDDITKGVNDVVALSGRHGGQIYERNINIADDRSSSASFVIKLPPSEIQPAIDELDGIGTNRTASQGTEDLTSQAVDIDARLLSAQASLDRVRKLLESATDLGQVISLESQLTERETTVEQLLGMKRAVEARVSLATLRVQLSLTPVPTTATIEPKKPAGKPTISRAFESGWKGFVNVLAAIMILFGYTAPFLVVLAMCAAVLLPISRRRRRRQGQQRRSAAPPPPPAPVADAAHLPAERPSQPSAVST